MSECRLLCRLRALTVSKRDSIFSSIAACRSDMELAAPDDSWLAHEAGLDVVGVCGLTTTRPPTTGFMKSEGVIRGDLLDNLARAALMESQEGTSGVRTP